MMAAILEQIFNTIKSCPWQFVSPYIFQFWKIYEVGPITATQRKNESSSFFEPSKSPLLTGQGWSLNIVVVLAQLLSLIWFFVTPVDCSMPGFPDLHQLLEPAQTHVYWVGNTIQLSHTLSIHCPPAFNLTQNQDLFQWISSSHQVAKVLEFQLQHQLFQWIFRTDFL